MEIAEINIRNLQFTNFTLIPFLLHKNFYFKPKKRHFLSWLEIAFEGKRVHSKTNTFQILSSNQEKEVGNLAFFSIEKNSFDHTILFQSASIPVGIFSL